VIDCDENPKRDECVAAANNPINHVPITNPFKEWPFNGDLVPFTKPQDGVCSAGPVIGPLMDANPGMLSACQWHDNQYDAYKCNATSWIPLLPGPCTVFNIVLVVRVIGALF
jgi:hypothetical protein